MASLIVREPGCVPYTVEITDGLVVGRDPKNQLAVRDAQASRQHARFDASSDGFKVSDLGATHGTLVNGAPVTEHHLTEGDEVQIGNVLLVYRAAGDPPLATAAGATPRAPADARRLQVLFDITRAIGSIGDADELVGRMLETTLAALGCERAVVGLREGGATPAGGRRIARGSVPVDDVVISRGLLESMLVRRESVLVVDRAGAPPTLIAQGVRSAMGAPLVSSRGVLGYVYVDDRSRADRFGPADLTFLTALAHLTVVALEQAEQHRRALDAAAAMREARPLDELAGASVSMQQLRDQVRRYARATASVLIQGESGTGKELVARTLQALSPRAAAPFVTVNCAAIPETMIESELFGHEKGAFTGALRARRGKFALADGGTLFLDEIGDLSAGAQSKVLRALQEGEIQPVGSERTVRVDVRVISATHKDLQAEIAAGRFREDLFFRLAVGELTVPPLRDRGDDVFLLAETFLAACARRQDRPGLRFSHDAVAALRAYPWPGNVRQLQNEVERAVILGDGPVLELPEIQRRGRPVAAAPPSSRTLAERWAELDVVEMGLIKEAVATSGGNLSDAARLLGISRVMVKRRLDRSGGAGEDGADGATDPTGETTALALGWQRLQEERKRQDDEERAVITSTLQACAGVVSRAARALGLPRTTLASRMEALGLDAS